jgi:type I restriction enzyme S subunit
LIHQRKESLRLLDEFLKSTFLEMFGDPLRGENLKPLGDHLRLQHGYAFKSKDFINKGIPVIKIGTINKGYFDIESLSYLGDEFTSGYDQYTIQPGDLLISLTGTVGKDDYANTCFVPEIFRKYLLNQRVAKLVPDERFLQKSYLDFAFKYPGLKKRLIRSNRGIRQANLSSNDIYSIRINIPPISEQIHFTSIVERVEVLRGHYISSLQELNNLHGSLSQRAFQAELYLREETLANAAEPEGLYRKTRK